MAKKRSRKPVAVKLPDGIWQSFPSVYAAAKALGVAPSTIMDHAGKGPFLAYRGNRRRDPAALAFSCVEYEITAGGQRIVFFPKRGPVMVFPDIPDTARFLGLSSEEIASSIYSGTALVKNGRAIGFADFALDDM